MRKKIAKRASLIMGAVSLLLVVSAFVPATPDGALAILKKAATLNKDLSFRFNRVPHHAWTTICTYKR